MSFYEPLLQSPLWQAFQEKSGKRCLREGDTLLVIETLPVVGEYLYVPRWPNQNQISKIKFQKSEIESLAAGSQAGWVRVEPENEDLLHELKQTFGTSRVVPAPHDVQPREILVLDIARSEETLLLAMKSKTRYNVRLAEKHGVTVRFSRAPEDLEAFTSLIYATTNRKAIAPHPKEYYGNFLATLPEEMCTLALAEYEGKVIAASLLVFYNGTAYYLHGGSADAKRELMAPFLLHFKSMAEAKRRGCSHYDFGGVSTQPATDDRRPTTSSWAGITRFKQGFDPKAETLLFPGTYDIILSPDRYRWYRYLQHLSRLRRFARNCISRFSV